MSEMARGITRWMLGSAAVLTGSAGIGVCAMLLLSLLFAWCGMPLSDGAQKTIVLVVATASALGAVVYALDKSCPCARE